MVFDIVGKEMKEGRWLGEFWRWDVFWWFYIWRSMCFCVFWVFCILFLWMMGYVYLELVGRMIGVFFYWILGLLWGIGWIFVFRFRRWGRVVELWGIVCCVVLYNIVFDDLNMVGNGWCGCGGSFIFNLCLGLKEDYCV